MFREFFLEGSYCQLVWAWSGLAVFLGHQVFKAYLSWAINNWYEGFYDLLQSKVEIGSGEGSGESLQRMESRDQIYQSLLDFSMIVAPAVVVHPLSGLWRNWWVFTWRRILMKSYLNRWNTSIPAIEGASQRVHEDSQRFASGIQSCVAIVLQSFFTLAVFCPVLYSLDPMLMAVAIVAAGGGLSVSMFVGWPLVDLEVCNQKVEAELRKKLVLLESDSREVHTAGTPFTPFTRVFVDLTRNYKRLYCSFAALGTWLAMYEQVAIILPYMFVAPRIYAARPEDLLTLGQLVKVTNAFGKVFDSLNVVSDRWLEINEWRSCVRRLYQFERDASNRSPALSRRVHVEMELSDWNGDNGDNGGNGRTVRTGRAVRAMSAGGVMRETSRTRIINTVPAEIASDAPHWEADAVALDEPPPTRRRGVSWVNGENGENGENGVRY